MKGIFVCSAGNNPALRQALLHLQAEGIPVTSDAAPNVTHLLLPVPSLENSANIRGGGALADVLAHLDKNVTVIGGNLSGDFGGRKVVDLLKDADYVAENAAITADCAIRTAGKHLPVVWKNCPVLVIGWGRIGKCLGQALHGLGAEVTVSARKETDRAMLRALGYQAAAPEDLAGQLGHYRVIFNTVPAPVLTRQQLKLCRPGCLKIELASYPGLSGEDVLVARGLPGKIAPESSGALIARKVMEILKEGGARK